MEETRRSRVLGEKCKDRPVEPPPAPRMKEVTSSRRVPIARRKVVPRGKAEGSPSSQEECKELQTGCGLSDMPQEVIKNILSWVTPLELLHIRTLNKYLRSIVREFRAQRTSNPWLLLSVDAPCRVNSADKKRWKKVGQYPFCWALEPETMRWKKLPVPLIEDVQGKMCKEATAVKVDSAGSSGLVVVWRSPHLPLVVGNLMTQKWQSVPANPKYNLEPRDSRWPCWEQKGLEYSFATHLVLDEKKKLPLKLVHFSSSEESSAGTKTCYAHCYCFSSKKWDEDFTAVPNITIPVPAEVGKVYVTSLTVHDTICAHGGIVFILVSFACWRRFLVLSYSVALGQFSIAVSWSLISVEEFNCSWNHVVLTFNRDAYGKFHDQLAMDERHGQEDLNFAGASAGRPAVWMKGLEQGLELLVAQDALWGGVRGSEIQVLKHDPTTRTWKVPAHDSSGSAKAFRRAQLREVVCGFCKEPTRKVSAVTFQMARSGQRSVFVAAYNDYCTQVGSYDMDTGLVRRVQTPLLPPDLHYEDNPASFWNKFTMQTFFPDFTDSDCS